MKSNKHILNQEYDVCYRMSAHTLWHVHITTLKAKSWDKAENSRDDRVMLLCVHQEWRWVLKGSVVLLFKRAKMTAAQQRAGALVVALWSPAVTGAFHATLKRKVREKNRQSVSEKKRKKIHKHPYKHGPSSAEKRNVTGQACWK